MTDDEAQALKQQLRQKHLALRRRLTPVERSLKDSLLAQKLGRFLVHVASCSTTPFKIGMTIPFFDEPDPYLESFAILEENRISIQPYVPIFRRASRHLSFVHPVSLSDFKDFFRAAHHTDVWVCASPLWSSKGAEEISFWIVPGVCFTPEGYRIGYGTGFYDAHLSDRKGFLLGMAYDVQISDIAFSPQTHDIPMNMVITEHHTYVHAAARQTYPNLLAHLATDEHS